MLEVQLAGRRTLSRQIPEHCLHTHAHESDAKREERRAEKRIAIVHLFWIEGAFADSANEIARSVFYSLSRFPHCQRGSRHDGIFGPESGARCSYWCHPYAFRGWHGCGDRTRDHWGWCTCLRGRSGSRQLLSRDDAAARARPQSWRRCSRRVRYTHVSRDRCAALPHRRERC